MTLAACGDDPGEETSTSTSSTSVPGASTGDVPTSSGGATSPTEGATQGEGTASGASETGSTTETGGGTSTAPVTATGETGETSSGTGGETSTGATGEDTSTGTPVVVPDGVYLWTGAKGRGGDMFPDDVVAILAETGVQVELSPDAPPADLVAAGFGTLVYMSPHDAIPSEVDASATALVAAGGRLVLILEHCKNGCFSNAAGYNALMDGLGAGMRFFGDGGTPLNSETLAIATPVPLVTDGVTAITVYYSGHIEPGAETTSVAVYQGETIVAHEAVGAGEVLGIADGSVFGYVLKMGNNQQFVANLRLH